MTDTLYSASAVAKQLGISRQRVVAKAQQRGIGKRPRAGVWLFTPADLVALREPRKPGRPRKNDGILTRAESS